MASNGSDRRISLRQRSAISKFGIHDYQRVDKCFNRKSRKTIIDLSSDEVSDQMSDKLVDSPVLTNSRPLRSKQDNQSMQTNGKNDISLTNGKAKSSAKQSPIKRRLFVDTNGETDKRDDNKRTLRQRGVKTPTNSVTNGSEKSSEKDSKRKPKTSKKTPKVCDKQCLDTSEDKHVLSAKKKSVEMNGKVEPKPVRNGVKRKSKVFAKSKESLDLALERLSSNSIPESLPCRESQFKDILNYVESKLIEGNGGCMYISGVPGTGKTATVREMRRKLESSNKYPKFTFIEVNGLKLSDPFQCYVQIHYELTGEKKSSYAAADALNDRFSNADSDNEFVILFVDELDLLRTRKQNILYHLFDWPTRHNSKLIVLAIANSMDLPEKLMINRVSSRLGLTRLSFHPYSYRELESIISSRLEGLHNVFDGDALQLICRKVAAVSGDARRALDICRLSVQTAQMADELTVSLKSVDTALQEIFNSLKLVRIRNATLMEKLFLQSIVQEFRISGLEECNFIDVFKHQIEMCHFEGHYTPSTVEVEKIAYNLHTSRLIILEKSGSHLYKRIRLNVSVDDINFALKM